MKSATAEGFSNIALIKYMGKSDALVNQASNPSLSYTLPHLKSVVRITELKEGQDRWQSLLSKGLLALELSEKGRGKFLGHLQLLKDKWNYSGPLLVESANTFPSDCGIASSASSFAALTQAFANFVGREESKLELARLSRWGSGSSCRSFFAPWCLWNGDQIESVHLPYRDLLHMVVIVDPEKKSVSSTEAHLRVPTSPQFVGRQKRVQQRLEKLLSALGQKSWAEAFAITWDEFEDMHQLFETSQPPFVYRNPGSRRILEECKKIWSYKSDGPLVTMDAGANVHLLFRPDQEKKFDKMRAYFSATFPVIASPRT